MANESKRLTAAEETATDRRRRKPGTLDSAFARKLGVPEDIKEENKDYELRWSNDSENRIYARTKQDDWEKVPEVDPRPVGTTEHGKPLYAHLLRKRREFWNEDQKEKLNAIKERERGLISAAKSDPQDNRSSDTSYVPAGNSISSGYTP